MQSDGNSWKSNTFQEAITSELLIVILKTLLARIRVQQKLFFAQNLSKRVVHKLQPYEKCPFSNCSDLIASHCSRLLLVSARYIAKLQLLLLVYQLIFGPYIYEIVAWYILESSTSLCSSGLSMYLSSNSQRYNNHNLCHKNYKGYQYIKVRNIRSYWEDEKKASSEKQKIGQLPIQLIKKSVHNKKKVVFNEQKNVKY